MRGTGCVPDPPKRPNAKPDWIWRVGAARLPTECGLERLLGAVQDQGIYESCVGFGVSEMLHGEHRKIVPSPERVSPAYIWGISRIAQNNLSSNVGTSIGLSFYALSKAGFMRDSVYPYRDESGQLHDYRKRPPLVCASASYDQRLRPGSRRRVEYRRLEIVGSKANSVRRGIAMGHLVGFGIPVTDSFINGEFDPRVSVRAPPPGTPKRHMLVAFRYGPNGIKSRSSWGLVWGDYGNAWLTDEYMEQAEDPWICVSAPYFSS